MKIKLFIIGLFTLLPLLQLSAQQTSYVALPNTRYQKSNHPFHNFGGIFRRNQEMKMQQVQYGPKMSPLEQHSRSERTEDRRTNVDDHEIKVHEQQVKAEQLEGQRIANASKEELKREQAEISRERVEKEAYEKARAYFESSSLDANHNLALLEQKLASLKSNRTTKGGTQ